MGTNGQNLAEASLPSTMRICRESRAETLSRYRIIYPSSVFKFENEQHVSPPLVIDPLIDMVYMYAQSNIHPKFIAKWLDHLNQVLPGGLGYYKQLRVVGLEEELGWRFWDHEMVEEREEVEEEENYLTNFISRFHGLEVLFVPEEGMDVEMLGSDLERNVKKFARGKIPEIRRSWS